MKDAVSLLLSAWIQGDASIGCRPAGAGRHTNLHDDLVRSGRTPQPRAFRLGSATRAAATCRAGNTPNEVSDILVTPNARVGIQEGGPPQRSVPVCTSWLILIPSSPNCTIRFILLREERNRIAAKLHTNGN